MINEMIKLLNNKKRVITASLKNDVLTIKNGEYSFKFNLTSTKEFSIARYDFSNDSYVDFYTPYYQKDDDKKMLQDFDILQNDFEVELSKKIDVLFNKYFKGV